MTKKALCALALAVALATALTPSEVVVKWGADVLEAASRIVAIGPFWDHDG